MRSQVFGEIGDYNLEAELWQTRSALHICAGDFRGAEACWRRTRELAARNTQPATRVRGRCSTRSRPSVGRGATAEPRAAALEAALAIDTPASDGGTLIEKHYATAITRLRQGRRAEALQAADAVIEMVTAQPATGFHWADFAAGTVEVYMEMLEAASDPAERAAARCAGAAGLPRAPAHRLDVPRHPARAVCCSEGWLAWEQGQPSPARSRTGATPSALALAHGHGLRRRAGSAGDRPPRRGRGNSRSAVRQAHRHLRRASALLHWLAIAEAS